MSFKSKDLHYDKHEPAFLQRLKGAYSANDGRNAVQIARPKKDRLRTGDGDDDEPLIIDENGEVVAKKEFDGMVNGLNDRTKDEESSNQEASSREGVQKAEEMKEEGQKIAVIGGGRKRKLVKAVGGDGDDDGEVKGKSSAKSGESVMPDDMTKKPASKADDVKPTASKPGAEKAKKKAKKIKLSFDEPE